MSKHFTIRLNDEEIGYLEKYKKYRKLKGLHGEDSKAIKEAIKLAVENIELPLAKFLNEFAPTQRHIILKHWQEVE